MKNVAKEIASYSTWKYLKSREVELSEFLNKAKIKIEVSLIDCFLSIHFNQISYPNLKLIAEQSWRKNVSELHD